MKVMKYVRIKWYMAVLFSKLISNFFKKYFLLYNPIFGDEFLKYWVYIFYFSIQYGLSLPLYLQYFFISFLSKLTKKILWSTCMYYYQPFVSRIYTHIEIGFIFSIENIFSILIKKIVIYVLGIIELQYK